MQMETNVPVLATEKTTVKSAGNLGFWTNAPGVNFTSTLNNMNIKNMNTIYVAMR
jgi:hypothetical protein